MTMVHIAAHRCKPTGSSRGGFSLIECLIAMVVTMVGLLSVAGMLSVGIRLQTESRDATAAGAIARLKMEELQNFSPTAPQRVRGGSLTSNLSGYFDTPDTRFVRRWQVETSPTDSGVPAGTQRISVSIHANQGGVRIPPVRLSVLVPSQ